LSPAFATGTTSYIATASGSTSSITLTPILTDTNASVKVNGVTEASGSTSAEVSLSYGTTIINTVVTAQDGTTTKTYTVTVTRSIPTTIPATYVSGSDVIVSANGFTATGSTVNLALNYAPVTGTNLTVLNNTGLSFISGTFNNLAHGQAVGLSYNGKTYTFVASYYGGTGNDLVLVWAGRRPVAWGEGVYGELGNDTASFATSTLIPVTIKFTPLATRTVLALSAGHQHSLALCSDGTVSSWGYNAWGQLGNNSTFDSGRPVAVTTIGTPLAGKVVVAVSAASDHSLALCSDGTLVSWGENGVGELGNGTVSAMSTVPVAVTIAGTPLEGRSVAAAAAGSGHNLALCSDGTLVAWGQNLFGQFGDNTFTNSSVPVAVTTAGTPLQGKSIAAIAVGGSHNLALCSDGTLASWGENSYGKLGNNSTTNSNVPVAVTTMGTALEGKTVVAVAAGSSHSLALCSDGTVVSWGLNQYGQLGNNSTTTSLVPVAVTTAGTVLAGKTVVAITAGYSHCMATCSDGTVITWGYGGNGQLGNNSWANSHVPVAVSTSMLNTGENITLAASGPNADHNLALVATTVPSATTLAATSLTNTTAIMNGTVNANNGTADVSFHYGLDTTYGTNVAAFPAAATGSADTPVSMTLTGLSPSTTYHFRVNAINSGELTNGEDQTFTTPNTYLSSLVLDTASFSPVFSPAVTSYAATVGSDVAGISVIPTTADSSTTVTVNGASVVSGGAGGSVPLAYGNNFITIVVKAADQDVTTTYSIVVTRASLGSLTVPFASSSDVPLNMNGLVAAGNSVNFVLGYVPVTGSTLTVVNNTSTAFISGTFSNLAQGQLVELTYNGIAYHFLADYFGGSGNDLVLQWADTTAFAWGDNSYGQLDTHLSTLGMVPLAMTGALSRQRIRVLAAGGRHSLALCWDGSIAAWGDNSSGQLGLVFAGSSTVTTPMAVNASDADSALHGKTVIALAAGDSHSLALCSDGTVAAWGSNAAGQLGVDLATSQSNIAIAVNTVNGVSDLAGRSVVAIAAGTSFSLALCSDGTVVAWGNNSSGQLGNPSAGLSPMPTAVNAVSGVSALYGKSVTVLAAGGAHSLALCSDGTVVAWGSNDKGQLGISTLTSSNVPMAVSNASALYGKAVVSLSAGIIHSMALCSDGTVTTWGGNTHGQLGDNSVGNRGSIGNDSSVPVLVYTASSNSALYAKTVTGIAGGRFHSLARCSDGTLVGWGSNTYSQMGVTSGQGSKYPFKVPSAYTFGTELKAAAAAGSSSQHCIALLATPPVQITGFAQVNSSDSAVLFGDFFAGGHYSASIDYGPTTAYGTNVTSSVLLSSAGFFNIQATGLTPATTYHFRVNGGSYSTPDLTFTTLSLLQSWRYTHFSTTANSGLTADTADYDNDGISNLMEYALNLNPKTAGKLPVATAMNGMDFEYTYTRSTVAVNAGTTFTVEWSATLPATWSSAGVTQTVLSDDGTTQQVKAVVPMNAATQMFVHLSVTAPP
jgi:alpha-tubulin suppressor-like RCC1 family protein